ncbi:hypothetical protein N0V83_003461 [Neocucurbitaria cava]|uniref:Uncharacterized protein n=1 Tax=Neocucurbitaria cava TaxID=798079 RepID=A0A9W9CNI5_9PLEO|nr:hypothetical protein N0V83_003461 [Neocucurbitaria cava]
MASLDGIASAYHTLASSYLPCLPTAKYHDLACGHRVQAPVGSPCALNCTDPLSAISKPFICRICVAQPILEGLGMLPEVSSTSSSNPLEFITSLISSGSMAGALLEDEVRALINQGHRDAVNVPKTDGLAEFVRNFEAKGGVEGGDEEVKAMEEWFRGLDIKTEEEKMVAMDSMEKLFRGLDIKTEEEKMVAMESVLAVLGI